MDLQQRQSNRNQQTSTTAISAPATNSIVSEPRVFFQRRYKPTSFPAARCLSRNICTNYVCTEKVSGQTEKGSKPTHSGFFRASHCFVKLNEWSLSWSCILLNLGRVRFHLDFFVDDGFFGSKIHFCTSCRVHQYPVACSVLHRSICGSNRSVAVPSRCRISCHGVPQAKSAQTLSQRRRW